MTNRNIGEAIIDVLKSQSRPLSLDELAFRARSTPSLMVDVLSRLQKGRVIKQVNGNKYELNRHENEFNVAAMY